MSRESGVRRNLGGWTPGRALVAVLVVALAVPAEAIDLSPSSGKFRLNIDTTLSWGASYRLEDRDPRLIGLPSGGTAYSVNGDDGNLNFDTGIVSNALKATIDVDLVDGKNFGDLRPRQRLLRLRARGR